MRSGRERDDDDDSCMHAHAYIAACRVVKVTVLATLYLTVRITVRRLWTSLTCFDWRPNVFSLAQQNLN